jgi:hypothetical protein
MNGNAIPAVLQERLGSEATGGLLEVFETAHREWRDEVIAVCAERFERRLVDEIGGVRLQIAHVEAATRQGDSALRQEMTQMGASLRQEMMQMGASLRQEMADGRFELLKWCFLFWAGQAVAVVGLLGLLMRVFRP